MRYSTKNLVACLLAISTHEALARPQGIQARVGLRSENSTIPPATPAISVSVIPDIALASEVLASSRDSIQSLESLATSSASEAATTILRPLPGLQTEEAGPLVPLPGLASDTPPVAVDETAKVTSEAATPAETSVSLRPLPGLASSVC